MVPPFAGHRPSPATFRERLPTPAPATLCCIIGDVAGGGGGTDSRSTANVAWQIATLYPSARIVKFSGLGISSVAADGKIPQSQKLESRRSGKNPRRDIVRLLGGAPAEALRGFRRYRVRDKNRANAGDVCKLQFTPMLEMTART